MKIKQPMLFVKNIKTMTAFYRDVMGLKVVAKDSSPGFVVLDAGNARLALHAVPAAIAKTIKIAKVPKIRKESPVKIVYGVADPKTERERLVAAGVRMMDPWPWGACDGVDPEGNVFQIAAE